MPNKKTGLVASLLMMVCLAMPAAAASIDTSNPAFAPTGGVTSIPVGHAEFCKSYWSECGPTGKRVEAVELDEASWGELLRINQKYNAEIKPVTDAELYNVSEFWTYPDGAGDCEDFVLVKRRALLDAGWPQSTLLIAVVRQRNGEGHAVLMVRTDRGDLVLDNQDGLIRVWNETPYQYLKRQSQADQSQWVDIIDNRPTYVAQTN